MKRLPFALLCCVLGAATAQTAPATGPTQAFEGRDLFSLQMASDPQISRDGKTVAYTRIAFDVMTDAPRRSVWLIDVASGTQSPLASGNGSHSTARWSPDGKRIAYVSTADDGRAQLFVRWLASGQSARLAELLEAPDQLTWSPDGRQIAFTQFALDEKAQLGKAPPKPEGAKWASALEVITDITYRADDAGYLRPGFTHVYVVPADGGVPRQVTFGAFDDGGPLSWSADAKHIYFTGNRRENWQRDRQNTEAYRVTLADGVVTALTSRNGPDTDAVLSPDGSSLAYVGYDDKLLGYQNAQLHLANRDGNNIRVLTSGLDRTVATPVWSADSRSIFVNFVDHGVGKLARVALNGRMEVLASGLSGPGLDRPYVGESAFTVSDNGVAAVTVASAQRPAEIAVVSGSRVRQLTRLNEGLLATKDLAQVRPLAVTSSFDQRSIESWLVTPARFDESRKYPLILEIHGGPYTSYGPVFSTDNQLYASAGYVVLYTNPRGSTSYGEEFANQIQHDYPGHDYDDLMSAVDAAIATGHVDSGNLFVTGGSGGGVLTAWIVGKTNRFRAAASQKPVINWTSTVLTTDISTFMPRYWFAKLPWEDPDSYWKRSPLSLVGSTNTPTMVVVGDQDYRTPVSESEQYYQALQLKGVPTALVKVPGASHGGLTGRPSQSAAKASAIIAWFDRYRTSK